MSRQTKSRQQLHCAWAMDSRSTMKFIRLLLALLIIVGFTVPLPVRAQSGDCEIDRKRAAELLAKAQEQAATDPAKALETLAQAERELADIRAKCTDPIVASLTETFASSSGLFSFSYPAGRVQHSGPALLDMDRIRLARCDIHHRRR